MTAGAGGALITLPSGEEREVQTPAGAAASERSWWRYGSHWRRCGPGTGSCPGGRTSSPLHGLPGCARHARNWCGVSAYGVGADIWRLLLDAPARRGQTRLQWVPAQGNENADELAKGASSLPQEHVSVDVCRS